MSKKVKAIRTVHVNPEIPTQGRPKLWAFGYRDFAQLFGITEEEVYYMARQGFDFGDLNAICTKWWDCKKARLVRDGNW